MYLLLLENHSFWKHMIINIEYNKLFTNNGATFSLYKLVCPTSVVLVMSKIFDDKSFVNPANHEETFSWSDLMNDYKFWKRQRKLAEYEYGAKVNRWFEYRKLALKCYYNDHEGFTNLLCK